MSVRDRLKRRSPHCCERQREREREREKEKEREKIISYMNTFTYNTDTYYANIIIPILTLNDIRAHTVYIHIHTHIHAYICIHTPS